MVLFFTLSITNAQGIPKDKQLHFGAGLVSGTVGYEYVYSKTNNRKKAFAAGILTSVLAGVVKETYDSTQSGNKFDIKDLGATALGGISVNVTIQLFNKKKRKQKKHEK